MSRQVIHVLDSCARAGQIHDQASGLAVALRSHGWAAQTLAVQNPPAVELRSAAGDGPATWQSHDMRQLRERLGAVDVVHILGVPAGSAGGLHKLLGLLGARVILTPCGGLLPHPWRRITPWQRLTSWLSPPTRRWRSAAMVHAANEEEAAFLRRCGHLARVRVVPIGVNAAVPDAGPPAALSDVLGAAASRRCLLFLGPIHPLEGLVPMLKACEPVVPEAPDWHLVIAGPTAGRWLDMIRAAVERRGLSERVTFLENPDPTRQHDLLRHCEVVIQPSLLAGPPLSAQSGLLHGKPCVVSTRCHLTADQADWAWQSEPQKAALTATLESILGGSAADHRQRGARGRQWVLEHRVWDVLAAQYAALYEECFEVP